MTRRLIVGAASAFLLWTGSLDGHLQASNVFVLFGQSGTGKEFESEVASGGAGCLFTSVFNCTKLPSSTLPVIGLPSVEVPFIYDGGNPDIPRFVTAHPIAGLGVLKVTNDLDFMLTGLNCRIPSGCGAFVEDEAAFVLDDVIITHSGGGTGVVPASVNFDVSGRLFAYAINPNSLMDAEVELDYVLPDSPGCRGCSGDILRVNVYGFDSPHESIATARRFDTFGDECTGSPADACGIFADFAADLHFSQSYDRSFSLNVSTPQFAAPVGVKFPIGLSLSAGAHLRSSDFETGAFPYGRANVDLPHTVSLSSSRPVFNLPPGYTANSVSGLIVDNMFVGGDAPPDTIPPVSTAVLSPQPNPAGWNNSDVAVTLSASDNTGGRGVKEITYSVNGAETIPNTTVAGASASIRLAAEGTSFVTFFAKDNAGNVERANDIAIRIDKTPPFVVVTRTPPPNPAGWNNTPVTAHFAADDPVSGVAGMAAADVVFDHDGADQQATRTFVDVAGNSVTAMIDHISIDMTPPSVACAANPSVLWPPNGRMVPIGVVVAIDDQGSGPAGFALTSVMSDEPDPSAIQGFVIASTDVIGLLAASRLGSGRGRTYTLTYSGRDAAGNPATCQTTVAVPHDQGKQ
jgi:hypothetical protein